MTVKRGLADLNNDGVVSREERRLWGVYKSSIRREGPAEEPNWVPAWTGEQGQSRKRDTDMTESGSHQRPITTPSTPRQYPPQIPLSWGTARVSQNNKETSREGVVC